MTQNVLYKDNNQVKQYGIKGMPGLILLCIGQIVSLIGSGMTCFAQSVWVYTDLGGSITNLTMLAVFATLPGVFLAPLAGAIVDRLNRRWVMILCNSAAAVVTMILRALILSKTYELWHIYLITMTLSIINHFQWPAFFATIPMVVSKKNLVSANGMVQLARSFGQIAAPFMAGAVVTLFSIQGVILFDMVSYIFALLTLFVVWVPNPDSITLARTEKRSLWKDVVEGWKYVTERPGLYNLLWFFAASNFLLGIIGVLLLPLALSVTTITVYASLMSYSGLCMLISSMFVGVWGGPKRRIYGVLIFVFVQGIGIMLGGFHPSIPIFMIAILLFNFSVPIVNSCGGAIWQTKVPLDFQGRILAVSGMASVGAMEMGYLIAGPLADFMEPLFLKNGALAGSIGKLIGVGPGRGIGFIFVLFGILSALVAIIGFMNKRLRNLDHELPDTIGETPTVANILPSEAACGFNTELNTKIKL